MTLRADRRLQNGDCLPDAFPQPLCFGVPLAPELRDEAADDHLGVDRLCSAHGVVSVYDSAGRPVRSLERFGDQTVSVEYGVSEARIVSGSKQSAVKASPDELIDPTQLWFWQVQPTPGTTTIVTWIAKNVGKKVQTRRTFEGVRTIDVLGRPEECFLVQVQPVGSGDTRDLEWYDRRGMLVRKEHRTTQSTYVTELVGRR